MLNLHSARALNAFRYASSAHQILSLAVNRSNSNYIINHGRRGFRNYRGGDPIERFWIKLAETEKRMLKGRKPRKVSEAIMFPPKPNINNEDEQGAPSLAFQGEAPEVTIKMMGNGLNIEQGDDEPLDKIESMAELSAALPNPLQRVLAKLGHSHPSPVQASALPYSLTKKYDLMCSAQTGSGKTMAFLLPALADLISNPDCLMPFRGDRPIQPTALVLAPTRELAVQIHAEANKLAFYSKIQNVALFGGAGVGGQLQTLAGGAHLLVATPGRLIDFLEKQVLSLQACKHVIIDEADRMIDIGFMPQLERIFGEFDLPARENRFTQMFSATFERSVRDLATQFLRPFSWIEVGRVGAANANVEQRIERTDGFDHKASRVNEIIRESKENASIIVFSNTKRCCDDLAGIIDGPRCVVIHGNMTQYARDRSLKDFRLGKASVMVATDVAARGLDIPGVDHVINFDLPQEFDNYVHRIGRTGRAGRTGVATAFFNSVEDMKCVAPLKELLENSKQTVPDWLQEMDSQRQLRYGNRRSYGGRGGGRYNRSGRGYGGGNRYGNNSYGSRGGGGGGGYRGRRSDAGYGSGYAYNSSRDSY